MIVGMGTGGTSVRILGYAGASVAVVLCILGVLMQPVWGLLFIGGILSVIAFLLIPREKVAGVSGKAAISLLVFVPVLNIGAFGNLKYVILGAVSALAVGTIIRRPDSFAGRPKGLWLFILYFVVVALATPRSVEPSAWSLFQGSVVAALVPALLFSMMNAVERRSALKFTVGLGSAEAAYALIELVAKLPPLWGYYSISKSGDPNLMYNQLDTALIRSQGTMGHPLPLALLLLVALALVIRGIGPKGAPMKVLTVVLLLAGCFAAGSRSALAVALILILLGIGKVRWKAIVVGSYLIVLGGLIAIVAGALESAAYQRFANSASLSHRTGALEAVPGLLQKQDALETFLGNGYFSAYQLFRRGLLQTGNFFAVDNQFVMTLVEGGLVGLAVLIVLVATALTRIIPSARLGLLSVVVFFLSFDVLSWPSGAALFGLFIGMAFSTSGAAKPHPQAVGEPGLQTAGHPATIGL